MPVTFHSLEDASTAPEGVKKLVANLQRPLSGKQKLESLPSMTPLALAQLQRVQDQANNTCSTSGSFDTISSVANLVLTTSAAIEQLSCEGNGLEARSIIPHWYTLLRTIARASHPDVDTTGCTPFIYPRGFGGEEGIAEMLIGFAADQTMVGLNLEPEHSKHSDMDNTSSAYAEGLRALVEDHESISESGVGGDSDMDDDESISESGVGEDSDADEDESISESGAGEDSDVDDDEEAMAYEEDDHTEESYDEARDHPMFSADYGSLDDIRVHDEAELFFGLDAIDEHEPPEETWLDLPNWSHILAGCHSGPVVLFPVLCVASETEIVPLMASAAYQRHAWDVDLPVVGLAISASSCSARVYIAWVDPLSDIQHMPTVHIMHPMPDTSTRISDVLPLPGSFDLADPQSSLALAQFIFSLSYQFDVLQKELPSRRLRRFTWRSDDDATLWAGSIEEWRARIDGSDESSTSDASDTPSPITPKDTDTFTMPPKPASGRGHGKAKGQSRSAPPTVLRAPSSRSSGTSDPTIDTSKDTDIHPADNSETTSTTTESDPAETKKKKKKKRTQTQTQTQTQTRSSNACSSFAIRALGNKLDHDTPSMTNWMLYRFVFTLTRTPGWNTVTEGSPPELSRNLAFYDEFTCLHWPKEWTELDRVAPVDSCLAKLRAQLFREYEEYKAHPSEPSAESPPELEAPLASLVCTRLSLLLKCVDSAYTKASRQKHTLEIECRHDFDSLFMNFFVDDPEKPTSPDVFLECHLRLAKNTLLGHLRDEAADDTYSPEQLYTRLQGWLNINRAIGDNIRADALILRAARAEDTTTLHDQCFHAEISIQALVNEYFKLRKQPNFRDMVEKHSTMEPHTGTCDAALVISFPIALNTATKDTQEAHQAALEQSQFINLSDDQSRKDKPSTKSEKSHKDKSSNQSNQSQEDESSTKASKSQKNKSSNQSTKSQKGKSSDQSSKSQKEGSSNESNEPRSDPNPHPRLFKYPIRVHSGDYPPYHGPKVSSDKPRSPNYLSSLHILLPQLLVEYKRASEHGGKALNQARMYCISALYYYASMGIKDYPVFGFAADGKVGALLMGWMSSNGAVYLLERNARRFDISQPIQAFHLATIVLRLKAREKRLKEIFEARAKTYVEDLSNGRFKPWAAEKQAAPAASSLTTIVEAAEH